MGAGETAVVGETGTGDVEKSTVVDIDEPSVGKPVVGGAGVGETGVSEARPAGVGKAGAGETSVDKTGAGETRARSVENCAGAAESCVETLRNEVAASEAA